MTAAMIRSTPKAINTQLGPSADTAMNSCCTAREKEHRPDQHADGRDRRLVD
jgi:hypothetical protein